MRMVTPGWLAYDYWLDYRKTVEMMWRDNPGKRYEMKIRGWRFYHPPRLPLA